MWVQPTVESCCFNLFCCTLASTPKGDMLAVCGRFASFLFATLFRTQTTTCLQSWLHFRTPGRAPKKGPCPSFQDSVPTGEEFGAQIWGPDLGPNSGAQIWAHLAMLFWLLVCARRACNSPNSYALPRGGRAACGRDICLMDQSNRSNIFSTVFRDVNLAAATVGGLRAEARNAWFFRPRKGGPQFQLRLPRKRTRLVPPCCVARQHQGGPRSFVNMCHAANMTTLIHCLIP